MNIQVQIKGDWTGWCQAKVIINGSSYDAEWFSEHGWELKQYPEGLTVAEMDALDDKVRELPSPTLVIEEQAP